MKDIPRTPPQENILTVKNEIPWDLDHHSDKKPDADYNVNMDAKTILELCKSVFPLPNKLCSSNGFKQSGVAS